MRKNPSDVHLDMFWLSVSGVGTPVDGVLTWEEIVQVHREDAEKAWGKNRNLIVLREAEGGGSQAVCRLWLASKRQVEDMNAHGSQLFVLYFCNRETVLEKTPTAIMRDVLRRVEWDRSAKDFYY